MIDLSTSTILVTGGTGSFGRKFAEVILRECPPRKLIIYSRDECKQHDMRVEGLEHDAIRYFIGDVRDRQRLRRAMQGVDIVVHAAALKQVPACEYNPIEAVNTNINGARNVIDAALDTHVRHVIALSTDKAAAPVNLYGATKLVAEKLFVHANTYSGRDPRTCFACVRYGNVLGSRGSVLPLFNKQKDNGKLTITDERMTRFWITIEQGVRFVLSCLKTMYGGEVFVPKLPAVNILDLAKAVAPEAKLEVIGIRPGEKLHELLISADEAPLTIDYGDRYIILPAHPTWEMHAWRQKGHPVPDGFCYSSGMTDCRLPPAEILNQAHV